MFVTGHLLDAIESRAGTAASDRFDPEALAALVWAELASAIVID